MRFTTTWSLLVFVLANIVDSSKLGCMWGCQIPASYFVFTDDNASGGYYQLMCQSMFRVQSMYLCMRDHCTASQIKAGIQELTSECVNDGLTTLLPWSVIDNITTADEATLQVVGYADLSTVEHPNDQVYDGPIVFGKDVFAKSLKTGSTWDDSEATRARYGYAMYGFWGCVLLVGICNRLYVLVSHRPRLSDRAERSTQVTTRQSKSVLLSLWIKRHITTPATFNYHAAQPIGWCTIPPRLQSAAITAFVLINLVLCCVSYELFDGNLYWNKKSTQLSRYLADRTGCIAIANVPLIWAFAMRNNTLMWLTGWDFATFNQFHRWVSRVATVEAVIHSVAYTVEAFQEGGAAEYYADWADRYWWMGVIATMVMSILCGISIYPIRKHWYEAFLLVHIFLAIWFLLAMWYHVEIFDGEYNGYIWPCVALWSFDRALRLARLVYLNVGAYRGSATYSDTADVVRLEVPVRSKFAALPGTYYYVYMLNNMRFWESHPFTLSSWSIHDFEEKSNASKTVSFAIRPYDGFTARIRNEILRRKGQEAENGLVQVPVRIAIEGPYGSSHSLQHCDSSLFIIGGSGITVALAHIHAFYDLLRANQPITLRRIHLVWAVRDYAMFQDFFDHELSTYLLGENGLASKLEVQIDLHVTRGLVPIATSQGHGAHSPVLSDGQDQDIRGSSLKEIVAEKTQSKLTATAMGPNGLPDEVRVSDQRPDIGGVVVADALRYAVGSGKMAVVCCGPGAMMDDSRRAVVDALGKGCDGIEFYPESFGW